MTNAAVLRAPRSMNHIAYPTWDSQATYDFYTRVLKCPFLTAIRLDVVPSSGERTPYLHTFYGLHDGGAIAFFEVEGLEQPTGPDPIPSWIRHVALNVDSMEELHAWKEHFAAEGVETVGIVDHDGVWESLYVFDPNGVRIELTLQTRPLTEEDARDGAAVLAAWTARSR
ncbi:Catechol 2,3-dioxygenase [Pseudonocardia thermophila]|jgi:Lactoylglutathione lyase and related lyases|uniref:Catechol 2,3-dioxygenase n=1 Tax=Pseudonocardia thermophila TaxID=1848 RepID=A0A1M6Y033_PSETH|nr:VOC family protein [Pseudonocardia thermophila]SHL11473.1 Catechol 2,3-dioxygenase [Pseudonocardia thermophila]